MGQWTPDYCDNVLASKIKGLVAGSIKRSKLENTEPSINYEAFVRELDTGDSFTTSLIDILVNELAERRFRDERRCIADRTAKSLRMLATPLRVYRERNHGRSMLGRRSVNLTEYMSAPQDELDMEEDDDDFESMLDSAATAIEGARVNSNLYDAYHTPSWTSHDVPPSRRPTHPAYSAAVTVGPSEANVDSISPPPQRTGPWQVPSVGAQYGSATLHRQPSIRRPIRSRTVDFNDFTSRRRSSIRQSAEPGSARPGSDDGADGYLPGTIRRSRSPLDDASTAPRGSMAARRFFPFSRARRRESSAPSWWTEGPSETLADEPPSILPLEPSASGSWFSLPTPTSSSSSQSNDAETSDERAHAPPPGPRLRRGGVRAPESMLSRHASPSAELGDTAYVIRMPPSPRSPLRFDDGHEESIADGLRSPTFTSATQTESQNEPNAGV